MTIYCDDSNIRGQCGGRLLYDFSNVNYYGDRYTLAQILKEYKGYMLIATFNQHQEKAYLACCKTFTLLGQSTPIKNPNSGNYIFTAIFKA